MGSCTTGSVFKRSLQASTTNKRWKWIDIDRSGFTSLLTSSILERRPPSSHRHYRGASKEQKNYTFEDQDVDACQKGSLGDRRATHENEYGILLFGDKDGFDQSGHKDVSVGEESMRQRMMSSGRGSMPIRANSCNQSWSSFEDFDTSIEKKKVRLDKVGEPVGSMKSMFGKDLHACIMELDPTVVSGWHGQTW